MRLNKQQVKAINGYKPKYEIGQTIFKVEKEYGKEAYKIDELVIDSLDFILRYTKWSNDPKICVFYKVNDYRKFDDNEVNIYANYADAQEAILDKLRKTKEQRELEEKL